MVGRVLLRQQARRDRRPGTEPRRLFEAASLLALSLRSSLLGALLVGQQQVEQRVGESAGRQLSTFGRVHAILLRGRIVKPLIHP